MRPIGCNSRRRPMTGIAFELDGSGDLAGGRPAPFASTAVAEVKAEARDVDAIERVLDINSCDFLVTVDGSGVGRNDAMISMLARRGEVLVHEIALQPGSAAIGHFGMVTALAVSGLPDQALAGWLTLAVPALDRLCGRQP